MAGHGVNRTYDLWKEILNGNWKGRRFVSHRGQAYFSSLSGVDIHSE
jgi:hypothetical protein